MKIAEHRKRKGMTQAELAQKVGASQAAVAHWENGRRTPGVKKLVKIAEVLGVAVGRLIG